MVIGSQDNTTLKKMVQRQFGDRSVLQLLVLVWSKVAELCSTSNNIRLHMEAAKLLPDPNQS